MALNTYTPVLDPSFTYDKEDLTDAIGSERRARREKLLEISGSKPRNLARWIDARCNDNKGFLRLQLGDLLKERDEIFNALLPFIANAEVGAGQVSREYQQLKKQQRGRQARWLTAEGFAVDQESVCSHEERRSSMETTPHGLSPTKGPSVSPSTNEVAPELTFREALSSFFSKFDWSASVFYGAGHYSRDLGSSALSCAMS